MNEIIENMYKREKDLSEYASKSEMAHKLQEEKDDIRPKYFRDIDKILYSLSFSRYMDKTQVFTYRRNDHVTKRMLHVQLVSKVARTIGRALNLNEDLIEAGALGHDLGHVPFGHVGEEFLNEISIQNNVGYFKHNIHSVRLLKEIENYGRGLNVTVETLDAIMCHNGEILSEEYKPRKKTSEKFLEEYNKSYTENIILVPSTLEGCVVRVSDFIAYIGRDIDDGINLNIINKENIPNEIRQLLGSNTKDIVNNIVLDIINNSIGKNYIKISSNVYESIKKLKKFNLENIYYKAYTKEERQEIKNMFETMFYKYKEDIVSNNKNSSVVNKYLKYMSEEYKKNTPEVIAIDYIAGMTDDYFIKQYNNINKSIKTANNKKEVSNGI